jgi:DNA invertase Pin-like site-specific DNA recombinase
VLVPDRYDDGGFSGGTLDRPALRRLLSDIEAGLVDTVVVYKIDRLSRSLMDFAKLVEAFERNGVTFVSVTQSFSTTTSMGRLTLNILLSFAQFEREVIGERIRDKVAASRRKGIFMGGGVPFGYCVRNRKLIVNEVEAEVIRRIFARFAQCGSALTIVRELAEDSIVNRSGKPIDKGAIYNFLRNRTYVGDAVHKGDAFPGEHQGIIPRTLFDEIQSKLMESARTRAGRSRRKTAALLQGLIFGPTGRAMSPTHTRKRGRLYRYYVSQTSLRHGAEKCPVGRVPAGPIEAAVIDRMRQLLRQPEIIVATWKAARKALPDLSEFEVRDALGRLDPLWDELFPAEQARIVQLLVERIDVAEDGIDIRLRLKGLVGLSRELGDTGEAPREAA